jgi:VanZ family protein
VAAVAKVVMLARMAAWPAVVAIIVLSVVPGSVRPHVLGNDRAEHFFAYLIAGSLFAIGYVRPTQLLSSGMMLTVCAGALEFVQLLIPGRLASPRDFIASTIGAWIGFLAVVAIGQARGRIR